MVFFKVCEHHTLTLAVYWDGSVWTSHMSEKSSRKLLRQSCDWIRDHLNAANQDVPSDLVQKWIYESDNEETKPSGYYLGVFAFGYFQHQLISLSVPFGEKVSVSSSKLLELFQKWQLKLAMVELNRLTDLRIQPMPLFSFPDGEQVEYWRDVKTREN